jgi:hypothetical protein
VGKPKNHPPNDKNKYNQCFDRSRISEIKLKRTDTTLDLSQKAKRAKEKRRGLEGGRGGIYRVWKFESRLECAREFM